MSYTIEVTMQDREGAVTRLVMLLSQRHLDIAQFSAQRNSAGTITAIVELEGSRERAPWTLRQVTRNHNVLAARVATAGASVRGKKPTEEALHVYPVRGRSLKSQRTMVVRRNARLAATKS
jgi:acetolactate synthase small subunit